MLAYLNAPMRGFVSPEQYARLSDWQIVHCLLPPRDDGGEIIPLRRRDRRADGHTGDPDAAGSELPGREELRAPPEAFLYGPPADFVLMTFQTYRGWGLTPEQSAERWKARMEREGRSLAA